MKTEKIKKYWKDFKGLLWPLKWYILANLIVLFGMIHEYLFPPAVDDPIWGAQATGGSWNYANQELYIESAKLGIIISVLVFLLGISNIRNHPKIAKFIFLSPWLLSLGHMLLVLLGMKMY